MKLLLLVLFVTFTNGANILGYFTIPSISHQITYQPVWKELVLRGHNVTVITPDPIKDPSLKNLYEIDLHEISYDVWDKYNISKLGTQEDVESTDISVFVAAVTELIDKQLSHPAVASIIANKNNMKFDILIVESFLPHAYPLKTIYNCPIVGITSLPLQLTSSDYIGNPPHPIVTPEINLAYPKNLNFLERVGSVLYSIVGRLMIKRMAPRINEIIIKHYKYEPRLVQLLRDVSLLFVNVNPILYPARPNVPSVIEFTGIHIKPPKELPQDLKGILDNATEGIIYISFGSNIKSSNLPKKKLKILMDTFAELPFKVLWKFEADDLADMPKNVVIKNWLPQQDVLRHPNLKLFITQGGIQSLDEAMVTKTPVIVIPFYGDQQGNARKAEEAGIGKFIKFKELTKELLKETILDVINDEKYEIRCEEVSNIMMDQPVPAAENIAWWIEYTIRHNGTEHMRSPAVNMPSWKYWLLDVIAFFAFITGGIIFIFIKTIKFILKKVNSKTKTE